MIDTLLEENTPFAKRLPEDEVKYSQIGISEKVALHLVSPAIEGYFRFPAIWVGSQPEPKSVNTLNPKVHHQVMITKHLDCGIIVQVLRNGMFLFDFSDWQKGPMLLIPGYTRPAGRYKIPHETTKAEEEAERIAVLRAQIMNVHQACMSTAEIFIKRRSGAMGFPVSAWTAYKSMSMTLPTEYFDDTEDPFTLSQNVMDNTYGICRSTPLSRRVQEVEVVEASLSILNEVLLHSNSDVCQLIESLYIAAFRFRDKFLGEAVTLGWTVCEQLISIAWQKYLKDIASNPTIANRMNKKRKEKLLGLDYTASMQVEGLELGGVIDPELYNLLEAARKSRNKWAHSLRMPLLSEAIVCMQAAEKLLELTLGLKIKLQHSWRGGVPSWPLGMLPAEVQIKARRL